MSTDVYLFDEPRDPADIVLRTSAPTGAAPTGSATVYRHRYLPPDPLRGRGRRTWLVSINGQPHTRAEGQLTVAAGIEPSRAEAAGSLTYPLSSVARPTAATATGTLPVATRTTGHATSGVVELATVTNAELVHVKDDPTIWLALDLLDLL